MRTLDELLRQAADGQGRTVLVSGEAGIGKTSLVERFVERSRSALRVLWGACEALFTPRLLGPLYDIAHQPQTPLRAALESLESGTNRATLFAAVLAGRILYASATARSWPMLVRRGRLPFTNFSGEPPKRGNFMRRPSPLDSIRCNS